MNPARIGRVLFRHRGWIPLPGLVWLVAISQPTAASFAAGIGLAILAEALRLWAVRHVGPASRTRGDAVGPLVRGGPYRWSRNPLYVGNLLAWSGLALAAASPAGVVVPALLAVQYGLIVAWEEERLQAVHGGSYTSWRARVPRWIGLTPRLEPNPPRLSPAAALRTERSTLAAGAVAWALVSLPWIG